MAAFSGHTEDGDELFGRRFSVAYSHVGTRGRGKRGEDGLPAVVFFERRGSLPLASGQNVAFQTLMETFSFCVSLGNEDDTSLSLPTLLPSRILEVA